jgi:hypothetical protein
VFAVPFSSNDMETNFEEMEAELGVITEEAPSSIVAPSVVDTQCDPPCREEISKATTTLAQPIPL